MNIFIFCLTILAAYGIIQKAVKEWKKADVRNKMEDIKDLHETKTEIKEFKRNHQGSVKKSRKVIKGFKEE